MDLSPVARAASKASLGVVVDTWKIEQATRQLTGLANHERWLHFCLAVAIQEANGKSSQLDTIQLLKM